ncbi:MAG: hypothetical protein ABI353_13700, partial [Isosphaeraceae bacterium]
SLLRTVSLTMESEKGEAMQILHDVRCLFHHGLFHHEHGVDRAEESFDHFDWSEHLADSLEEPKPKLELDATDVVAPPPHMIWD